jgi:hypothetical protein
MSTNTPSEMFGTSDPKDLAMRKDAFDTAIAKSFDASHNGDFEPSIEIPGVQKGQGSALRALEKAANQAAISKSMSPDALSSLQSQIAQQREIMKDITAGNGISTGSPIPTGLVAFDLEAPAKYLAPRPTPLRNKLPREKGQGSARRFKRITGITGSGTGGLGNIHPGIQESTQNNFAPPGGSQALYLNRGSKIAYAGDDRIVPYFQFSLSDSVTYAAQFEGQGFQDIRALSAQSLLYSSMLMEEKMLLMGRGTASGFSGALAAPGTPTLTARSVATGETAISGYTSKIWVQVTSDAGAFGESTMSAIANVAVTTGQVVDVVIPAPVSGALGYKVYVGTGSSEPTQATIWYDGRTGSLHFVVQGALPTSGVNAGQVTTNTSAYANGYDGIMPTVTGSESGYTKVLNSGFNATSPGAEFQEQFASLYNSVKADPDEILFNGTDRKNLSELLKSSSSTNYRLTLQQDEIGNAVIGSVITAIQNEVTGKVVPMTVHPWMPQGNTATLSYTLPIPDSQVSNVWSVVNVQDYMGIQWPVVDFQYQASSYWLGTFVCYAPAWNGSITGIAA